MTDTAGDLPPTAAPSPDEQRIRRIVSAIRDEEDRLRRRYPILQHQDALGIAILCLSLSGMLLSGYLYYRGLLPAYLSIPLSALFASLSASAQDWVKHRLDNTPRHLEWVTVQNGDRSHSCAERCGRVARRIDCLGEHRVHFCRVVNSQTFSELKRGVLHFGRR